jgi:hypothetical protein
MLTPLRETLSRHVGLKDDMGGEATVDREALRDELRSGAKHTRFLIYLSAAMTACVFLVLLVVIVIHREDTRMAAAMSGLMGLTVAGAITGVSTLARDLGQRSLIFALSAELPAERVHEVIMAILEGITFKFR